MVLRVTKVWVRLLRPQQWLKNGFVFAPMVFAGKWTEPSAWLAASAAALAFCLASSAGYILNDVVDAEQDRLHPRKKNRPIASGEIGPLPALVAAFLSLFASFALAGVVSLTLVLLLGGYVLLTAAYSFSLKRVVFVDVIAIACGFVLRVVGGAVAVRVPVSTWLLVCAYLLALYLALGKRRSELVLLGDGAGEHREVLGEYTMPLVDHAISVVLGATVVSYALYTVAPETVAKVGSRWMLATVPVVMYGLFRYLYLLHRQEDAGGDPSRLLLMDPPLLLCVLVWLAVSAMVVRFCGSG